MNNFLDTIIGDNSLRDYLITAIIILVVFVLKTYVSRLMADLIGRVMGHKKHKLHRDNFRAMVLPPIKFFVIVLTVLIAFSRLNFPTVLNLPIYKTDLHTIVESIARAVLIFAFAL